MNAHNRLFLIYERLSKQTPNYGLRQRAEVDGWILRMTTSDFGDLHVSAGKDDRQIAFRCGPDKVWRPITIGTVDKDIELMVDLAEKAEWQNLNVSTEDDLD